MPWTKADMPDLTGKIIIVTGANSGLGFETTLGLAEKGATVVLAVRNMAKGEAAIQLIRSRYPKADLVAMTLDLSELKSIHLFAEQFKQRYNRLDRLINNAGIMIPPLHLTELGVESQFACNHLGHFALTGLLLERLLATVDSRIVTISSLAAHKGQIDFENLDGAKGYHPIDFYGQSKLANMLFAKELQHRLAEHRHSAISLTCHPGFTQSNLFSRGSGKPANPFLRTLQNLVSQPGEMGALTTLYAATEPRIVGGEYIGPDGKKKRKGYPVLDPIIERLYQPETSQKLWRMSEELTGVTYQFEGLKQAESTVLEGFQTKL